MRILGKIFFYIISYLLFINTTIAADGGITGVSKEKLRNGDFQYSDIPGIFVNITNFFIGIAGVIAIIAIIIGSYKYLVSGITGSSSKGKDTIVAALIGFGVASCSYLIIRFIIDNFSSI